MFFLTLRFTKISEQVKLFTADVKAKNLCIDVNRVTSPCQSLSIELSKKFTWKSFVPFTEEFTRRLVLSAKLSALNIRLQAEQRKAALIGFSYDKVSPITNVAAALHKHAKQIKQAEHIKRQRSPLQSPFSSCEAFHAPPVIKKVKKSADKNDSSTKETPALKF